MTLDQLTALMADDEAKIELIFLWQTKAESKVLGKQLLCGSHVFILSPANGWETGLWSIVLAFLTSEKVFVFLGNCMEFVLLGDSTN